MVRNQVVIEACLFLKQVMSQFQKILKNSFFRLVGIIPYLPHYYTVTSSSHHFSLHFMKSVGPYTLPHFLFYLFFFILIGRKCQQPPKKQTQKVCCKILMRGVLDMCSKRGLMMCSQHTATPNQQPRCAVCGARTCLIGMNRFKSLQIPNTQIHNFHVLYIYKHITIMGRQQILT